MRNLFVVLLLAAAGCATTGKATPVSGGPSPWMCMPCAQPCTAYPGCAEKPKVAVATPPAPAPVAPAPVTPPPPPPPAAAAAEFLPAPGIFTGAQSVKVSSATPGAILHCTTDGSTPTADSPICDDPLAVTSTTTVKAVALAPGYSASEVAQGDFTIETPAPPAPVAEAMPAPPAPVAEAMPAPIELDQKVLFEAGKALVRPESAPALDNLAAQLKAHPEIEKVAVEGHADALGSAAFNLELSRARAIAVRNALVERGIDGNRLVIRGWGEARPVADNETPEGREANRRVELSLATEVEPAPAELRPAQRKGRAPPKTGIHRRPAGPAKPPTK